MKVKIILAIVLTSLCTCERQQRSTVLTDESKRILEHFDFSNFDKQEALNYLDRQRYENQIRGKRSHSKFKRDHNEETDNILDSSISQNNPQTNQLLQFSLKPQIFEENDLNQETSSFYSSEHPGSKQECSQTLDRITPAVRYRRGHRYKKKRRFKSLREDYDEENDKKTERKRKKKKKKKRHYWDKWSEWSPCSVTCGRGRKLRWRKCIAKNCTTGEIEMGEKTCQLPACNLLTKLLGL